MAAITLFADLPDPFARRNDPPELIQFRRESAAKIRRLEETILSLDNLLAPQDWLDAGDGFPGFSSGRLSRPAQRTQDRSHAPISYLNEDDWRYHVALARDLATRNHLALGFRDHVINFIGPVKISFVLRGQDPGASSGADGAAVDPLVRACTQAWDEWCEFAEWGQGEEDREEECRRRLLVEGETTLRFFVGDDNSAGLPYARHVEPELIRTPAGHSTSDRYGWGVITAEGDDEREEGLWLCDPANVSLGRTVAMSEYVRIKGNTDRTVKRGLSDLFPVGEQLRKVLGLLDNIAHVARLQAAIAWWEQYPTATLDQVMNQVRMGADYERPKLGGAAGARADVRGYEAGTVVYSEGGREVKPGPVSTGGAWFEAVERMVLRGIGFRWGCPSYFSGDGDASFASVLVTGSPFVRITESRQDRVKAFACRVAARVLEFCERSGRLPRGTCRRVRPVGTCKPVVIADEEKKARTFLSLYAANCADPVEYIRSTGADPKVVAANILAWKQKFPQQPPPAAPGGAPPGSPPPPPPPAGPTATPPGSAGGDGSSPAPTDVFGEHIGRTGEGREWVSEGLYALLSEAGRAGLTLVTVQGKTGPVKRWVRQGTAGAADDHAKRAAAPGSGSVIDRALADPSQLTAADVKALAEHVGTLDKESLRSLNLAFRQKIGGDKAALAGRLLKHVRGQGGGAAPEPLDLKHQDPNHPVAKAIAADAAAVAIASKFAQEFGARHKLAAEYNARQNVYQDALAAAHRATDAYTAAVKNRRTDKFQKGLRDQANKLIEEANRLGRLSHEAAVARQDLSADGRKRLAELIAPPDPLKADTDATAVVKHPDQQGALDAAHAFVGSVVNWDGSGPVRYRTVEAADGRAWHQGNTIAVGKSFAVLATDPNTPGRFGQEYLIRRSTQTQVHELGHHIEENKVGARRLANEFVAYRCGGEPPVELATRFPGSGYEPGEQGRKDNFDRVWDESGAYYVGKTYSHGSTEVVSMGLEKLYEDPTAFAANDPEYFTFMVSLLRG